MNVVLTNHKYMLSTVSLNRNAPRTRFWISWSADDSVSRGSQEPNTVLPRRICYFTFTASLQDGKAWITRISCICPESLCSVFLGTHLGVGLPVCAGSCFCLVNLQTSPRRLLGATAPPQHRRVHLSSFYLICHSRPGGCEVSQWCHTAPQ